MCTNERIPYGVLRGTMTTLVVSALVTARILASSAIFLSVPNEVQLTWDKQTELMEILHVHQ